MPSFRKGLQTSEQLGIGKILADRDANQEVKWLPIMQ